MQMKGEPIVSDSPRLMSKLIQNQGCKYNDKKVRLFSKNKVARGAKTNFLSFVIRELLTFECAVLNRSPPRPLVVYKGPIDPQKWTQKVDTKWTQKWTLLTSKKKWLKCLGIAGAGVGLPVQGCGFCPNARLSKCGVVQMRDFRNVVLSKCRIVVLLASSVILSLAELPSVLTLTLTLASCKNRNY